MANTIQLKRSTLSVAPTSLAFGELAWTDGSDTLYIGDGNTVTPGVKIIAGSGAFATLNNPVFTGNPTAPTATVGNSSTSIATTSFVTTAVTNAITASNTIAELTDTNVVTPTAGQGLLWDGVGNWVNRTASGDIASISAIGAYTLANSGVVAGTHTKVTVDAKGRVTSGTTTSSTDITDFAVAVQSTRLDQLAPSTASIDVNSQRILNVATPIASADAANKTYVDTQVTASAQGLDIKASVRLATIASNVTLAGDTQASAYTLDGVLVGNTDRVLVKNQTLPAENGIYTIALSTSLVANDTATYTRALDFDQSIEITANSFTFVEEGTVNADSGWVLATNNPITVGTTAQNWTQFTGTGQIVAGDGIDKAGNVLDIVVNDIIDTTKGLTSTGIGTIQDIQVNTTAAAGLTFNIGTGAMEVKSTDIVDTTKGLAVTTNNISVNTTAAAGLTFNIGTGAMEVKSTDIVDTTKGLAVTTNNISVNADTTSFQFVTGSLSLAPAVAGAGLALTSGVLSLDPTIAGTGLTDTAGVLSVNPSQTQITSIGTVTAGTWNATTIAPTVGGTGQSTFLTGDLLYASAPNTLSKRAAGTTGQLLQVVGGVPIWSDSLDGGTF